MNQNIITLTGMNNRNNLLQQAPTKASAEKTRRFMGTIQILLTAITMLFTLGVNSAWA